VCEKYRDMGLFLKVNGSHLVLELVQTTLTCLTHSMEQNPS